MGLKLCPAIIFTAFVFTVASATLVVTMPPFFRSGTLPVQRQRHTALIHEVRGSTTSSDNWSGYTVTGSKDSFATANGMWLVPTPNCEATPNAYSATWVGIDGWVSNTVEQIGTETDCINDNASNYAWYEFYPHNYYTIENLTINENDVISASVQYIGGKFMVSLTDESTMPNKPFSVSTKVPQAERKSAECIVEAPYSGGVLPLADFVNEPFTTCSADGSGLKSTTPGLVAITMVAKNGLPKATPALCPTLVSPTSGTVLAHRPSILRYRFCHALQAASSGALQHAIAVQPQCGAACEIKRPHCPLKVPYMFSEPHSRGTHVYLYRSTRCSLSTIRRGFTG